MVVPSYESVPPVHRLAASLVFQERGNRAASGMLPAIAMRCVRRKVELRVPSERRAANLRQSDNDGGGSFPMHGVSRAQAGEEARD
jgi:hypothetical protein